MMLDRFEITPATTGRLNFWQLLNYAIRYLYIIIINLPFLGRPDRDVWEFLPVAYGQIFPTGFPLGYKLFYFFFGKKFIQVCKYHGEPAGFALFRSGPRGNIHLCSMGIVAACRGKGLSKPFLAGCLNYWEKRGFKTASLYVDQTNHIALHTYRALAYQFIKTIDNKIFMFKPL